MSSTAEDRAGIVATIERDLLARFERAAPRERVAIEAAADVVVWVATLEHRARTAGCDGRAASIFMGLVSRLTRILHAIGPDRIAGTLAEGILAQAIATADTVLRRLTVVASA